MGYKVFKKPKFVTLRFLATDVRKLQIGGRSLFIYRGTISLIVSGLKYFFVTKPIFLFRLLGF